MKIAVLAGGYSYERDVSLTSASLIAGALCRKGHKVALVDVYKGVEAGDLDALFTDKVPEPYKVPETEPDLDLLKKEYGCGDALVGKNIVELCRLADIVYIGLHGGMGENGQLQAFLDCYGIKYTGTGYLGAALAMNKEISKDLFRGAGIPTPEGRTYNRKNLDTEEIEREIGFPCVIKPCSNGSSVGVSIVKNREEMIKGIEDAFRLEDRVIVEKKIVGREMTVAVLLGKPLPPVEIIPKAGFYDYKNKYQEGMTEEYCPPMNLSEEDAKKLGETAVRAAKALHIGRNTYCRVDMFLTSDGPVVLEVNALPGMTPISLLPREAKAAGIDYDTLCDMIAHSALEK